jgi:tungstate transport system ATP-binding protein
MQKDGRQMFDSVELRTDPRMISASGVKIMRDGKLVLDVDNLSFDGTGPTLILGPNGAGKSLLLRCLHGLVQPDEGDVRQGGRPLETIQRARQAMVFQRPVLLRRSVAGNLDFVMRRLGLPRVERAARRDELLQIGGLADKARQWARSLSGGEAQRLAILRALAVEPDILFLDEPTSALDPAATKAVEGLVRQAHARGTRIIMVTHDIGQARRLADDVVVLHGGQVTEHTPATEFFDRPRSRAARCFLQGRLLF